MFFASFLIVLLTPFINEPESSRVLTIFIVSFISSLDIINVVKPDPSIFLWVSASAAEGAAVNPIGIKTLLAKSTFHIKGNAVFSKGPKNLPKILLDYPILQNKILF